MNAESAIRRTTMEVDLRDVFVGALGGSIAGAAIGVLARVAMRLVAVAAAMETSFSFEGSLLIVVFSAFIGVLLGVIYMALRRWIPWGGRDRGFIYGVVIMTLLWFLPVAGFLLTGDSAPEDEFGTLNPIIGLAIFTPVPLLFGPAIDAAVRSVEARAHPGRGVRIGLPWLVLLGIGLVVSLTGLVSLMSPILIMPHVLVPFYRAAGFSFRGARVLHSLLIGAFALAYLGTNLAIFWRGAASRMARVSALALLAFSAGFFRFPSQVVPASTGDSILAFLGDGLQAVGMGALLTLILVFPDGRFRPRWTRFLAAGWWIWAVVWLMKPFAGTSLDPGGWPAGAPAVISLAGLGSALLAQFLRRRETTRRGDSHPGLVLAAFAAAILLFGLVWGLTLANTELRAWNLPGLQAVFAFGPYLLPWLLPPLAILSAMRRQGLWAEDPAGKGAS